MASDFSARGRSARASIPVPDVPLEAIRRRAHAARSHARMCAFTVSGIAVVLAAVVAGTGAGAKIVSGVRVWLSGSTAAMQVSSFYGVRTPTDAEMARAIAHASFPVVLPVGLPTSTRLTAVFATPVGNAHAIVLSYVDGATGAKPSFVLADPGVVELGGTLMRMSAGPRANVTSWRTGGEVVLVARHGLSAADAERVKTAMTTSSPAASLAATRASLATVTALDGIEGVSTAERYRPANGRSVLLDPQRVRTIPSLAASDRPVLDDRIFTVTHVPYVNGEPDYRHAAGWNAHAVAIPADGVRAIDAVLRTLPNRACACRILYDRANASTDWVWTLPLAPGAPVTKYAVDVRTLHVTSAGTP
ncbi:MAG TPA: hypothetical protein VHT53_05025 [Candidatus Elarobacter sp.]|jgi:hypothetical protein|nr:hypothetical protein [Candidatus Elarobacter sp.]